VCNALGSSSSSLCLSKATAATRAHDSPCSVVAAPAALPVLMLLLLPPLLLSWLLQCATWAAHLHQGLTGCFDQPCQRPQIQGHHLHPALHAACCGHLLVYKVLDEGGDRKRGAGV
jgi:hypothetical protein